jgi:hypothetical protein
LVSLAERLEDKPFHLLATHCQKEPKAKVVEYIKSQGLAPDTPNMTVTSFGGHADVPGNGSVPYYMVFDHTGKLVRQHMCGNYHGGDGLKMIEIVDEMLAKAPEIYLGEAPFEMHADLAAKVTAKKGFPGTVAALEAALAAEPDDELERVQAGLTRWRDGRLARADSLERRAPASVVPHLTRLAADLKGTGLGAPVAERLEKAKGSDDLKRAVRIAKELGKIDARLEKLKPCKTCKRDGAKSLRLGCSTCADENRKGLAAARKKLEALVEQAAGLPIAATVEARRDELP